MSIAVIECGSHLFTLCKMLVLDIGDCRAIFGLSVRLRISLVDFVSLYMKRR